MNRTLVIPDIHNSVERADAIISVHGATCDRIVFLGDFFDHFHDGPADAERVARWLLKSTQDPRRLHLIGNHDLAYLGGEMAAETYPCPGWSYEKYEAVSPVLQDLERQKIHAAIECDGWLLTHAGLHRSHLQGRTMEQVLNVSREAFERALGGVFDPLFAPSRARGFGAYVGGLTWLDWSREFMVVDGWHQIVGHTPSHTVRTAFATEAYIGRRKLFQQPVPAELRDRSNYTSLNWCIDTTLHCAGIIDEGQFDILWT